MTLMTFLSGRARDVRVRRREFRLLKAECGEFFHHWWGIAGYMVDQKLRYTGMRWEARDYGISVRRGELSLYHTKQGWLLSALGHFLWEEKTCEAHTTETIRACEAFRLEASLRRMPKAMRREAERRLEMLELGLQEVRTSRRYPSLLLRVPERMKRVNRLPPYGHPQVEEMIERKMPYALST